MRYKANSPKSEMSHWLVLVFALCAAVAIWQWWLTSGMEFARQEIVRHVVVKNKISNKGNAKSGSEDTQSNDLDGQKERDRTFAELGQTGDSFGSLNGLLTAIAGALVAWAGFMQHRSLIESRAEVEKQFARGRRQEFEALFFQLLQLSTQASEKITRSRAGGRDLTVTGSRALDQYAREVFFKVSTVRDGKKNDEILKMLLKSFFIDVFDRQPSSFGPYFRLLYQTVNHVSNSELAPEDQEYFVNIVRGQLSEGSVLLLALYGLTNEGRDFLPLIERFGLLEDLHRRYRKLYQDVLRIGFRSKAFLSYSDRNLSCHSDEISEYRASDFDSFQKERDRADVAADFEIGFDPLYPHDE